MAFIDDLAELFTDTATWAALSSRNRFGAPTVGAGTSLTVRLVRKHQLVRDQSGNQVVSNAQMWVKGAPAIAPEDQVTLSDGTSPPIIAVERLQDEVGASHTKVFFGTRRS